MENQCRKPGTKIGGGRPVLPGSAPPCPSGYVHAIFHGRYRSLGEIALLLGYSDLNAFGLSSAPTFTKSLYNNNIIQLDADTSVIIEGYMPAKLTDLLASSMHSSSIVL
jgi:hypothetical protein